MTAEAFLKELKRIIASQPKLFAHILFSEDCQYCDQVFWCKNLFYSFECARSSDCLYLYDSTNCANCVDCDYAVESELCYESVDPVKCFDCEYIENSISLRDSSYCYACVDCHDVFGCVHLKNKSFCILNRQLNESEYREEIKKYKSLPPEKVLAMLETLEKRYPWTQTNEADNENTVYGNYIYQNKNCYLGFDAFRNSDSAYLYDSHYNSRVYDFTYSFNSQLSYENVDCDNIFNADFVVYSGECRDSRYLFACQDTKDSLGCVGLKHKQYCLLNRQLTKEDYERLSKQIFLDLKDKNLGWADLTF